MSKEPQPNMPTTSNIIVNGQHILKVYQEIAPLPPDSQSEGGLLRLASRSLLGLCANAVAYLEHLFDNFMNIFLV